ncbi:MAG: phytoene/squalene synthase family protein [Hyphomicrobiales bacterium]|nr:phytoene/squalene synthase family protein [Hyphomicrobiales bacterium]
MDEIVRHARERIDKGSKSFAVAARLFQPAVRDDAFMLYAWCRHCDDLIDDQELGFARAPDAATTPAERLAELREQTRRAMAGEAEHPVFVALSRVVARHRIPERHPLELLDGFAMDVEGRRYRSLDDTLAYCYHVAGVVGVMMAMIMGPRDRATLNRASDLGIAFQLTNIARDVMEDAASGRVYLPEDWLEGEGVPVSEVADAKHRAGVFRVVARLLDVADDYYASSSYGVSRLPFRSAWAICAARRVYRDIGQVVRERGPEAWDSRAVVGTGRKLAGVGLGAAAAARAATLGRYARPPARTDLWTHPDLGA